MNFPESSLANLSSLGYTEDEARFLYVVATHSGYFSMRQFLQFTGTKSGDKSMTFSQKLFAKGHATARSFLRNSLVYHLFSRIVYRAIGRENLRNRRAHSLEHIRTRLVALDFVVTHLQYEYLETEDDKLNYFCQQLDLPKELLTQATKSSAISGSRSCGTSGNTGSSQPTTGSSSISRTSATPVIGARDSIQVGETASYRTTTSALKFKIWHDHAE